MGGRGLLVSDVIPMGELFWIGGSCGAVGCAELVDGCGGCCSVDAVEGVVVLLFFPRLNMPLKARFMLSRASGAVRVVELIMHPAYMASGRCGVTYERQACLPESSTRRAQDHLRSLCVTMQCRSSNGRVRSVV